MDLRMSMVLRVSTWSAWLKWWGVCMCGAMVWMYPSAAWCQPSSSETVAVVPLGVDADGSMAKRLEEGVRRAGVEVYGEEGVVERRQATLFQERAWMTPERKEIARGLLKELTKQSKTFFFEGYETFLENEPERLLDVLLTSPQMLRVRPEVESVAQEFSLVYIRALLKSGRREDATGTLRNLLEVYPSFPVTQANSPPEVIELYEQVRSARAQEREVGRVTLEVSDEDGTEHQCVPVFNGMEARAGEPYVISAQREYLVYVSCSSGLGPAHVLRAAAGQQMAMPLIRQQDERPWRGLEEGEGWLAEAEHVLEHVRMTTGMDVVVAVRGGEADAAEAMIVSASGTQTKRGSAAEVVAEVVGRPVDVLEEPEAPRAERGGRVAVCLARVGGGFGGRGDGIVDRGKPAGQGATMCAERAITQRSRMRGRRTNGGREHHRGVFACARSLGRSAIRGRGRYRRRRGIDGMGRLHDVARHARPTRRATLAHQTLLAQRPPPHCFLACWRGSNMLRL